MRNVDVTLLVNIPLTNPEGDCTEWKINVCCCWLLLPPLLLLLVVVLQSNDDLLQHCPLPIHRSLSHPFLPPVPSMANRPPVHPFIHSFVYSVLYLTAMDAIQSIASDLSSRLGHYTTSTTTPFASALEIILIALTVCLSPHRTHLCSCSSWMVVLLLWG